MMRAGNRGLLFQSSSIAQDPSGAAKKDRLPVSVRCSDAGPISSFLSTLLLGAIRLYQRLISPLLPPSCRFYPSCSSYAAKAISTRGLLPGLLLTVWRLGRCHPFNPGGYDPVPDESGTRIEPPRG